MLREHELPIRRAVAAFATYNISPPDLGNRFFEEWGLGARIDMAKEPWERFEYYSALLAELSRVHPQKFVASHKGTAFFFLAFAALDLGAFERALFFLDAAIGEDVRNNPQGWRSLPANKLMELRLDGRTAADRLVPELRRRWESVISQFRQDDPGFALAFTVVDMLAAKVFRLLLDSAESKKRHLVSALHGWVFDYQDLKRQLIIGGEAKGSVLPFLLHLFRGGAILESVLKLKYNGDTLGRILNSIDFKKRDPAIRISTSAKCWEDLTIPRPAIFLDTDLKKGKSVCLTSTKRTQEPRREPGGRPGVLDMDDRLGVRVPYRAS